MIFQALCLLLPLNVTLFCFMRERGVFTMGWSSVVPLCFLAGQAALVAWFVRYNYTGVERFLTHTYLAHPALHRLPLSQISAFVLILGSALVCVRILVRKSHLDSSLLGAMIAVACTCIWKATPDASLSFVTAGGLILVLGVLQDTYNMAYRDELTGLQARRAMNEQLMGLDGSMWSLWWM